MTSVIFLKIVVLMTFYNLKKSHAQKDSGSWYISAGRAKNCKKSQKNTIFSSFKPNYSKKGTTDFESFLKICSSNDTLSPQKNSMSSKIPIREIFAPDSAENCKKSQKSEIFHDWWQIL